MNSRDAVRRPFAVGEKVIATVHLAAGAKLVPQEFEAIRKSPGFAPASDTEPIVRVVVARFVKLAGCAALVVPIF